MRNKKNIENTVLGLEENLRVWETNNPMIKKREMDNYYSYIKDIAKYSEVVNQFDKLEQEDKKESEPDKGEGEKREDKMKVKNNKDFQSKENKGNSKE